MKKHITLDNVLLTIILILFAFNCYQLNQVRKDYNDLQEIIEIAAENPSNTTIQKLTIEYLQTLNNVTNKDEK